MLGKQQMLGKQKRDAELKKTRTNQDFVTALNLCRDPGANDRSWEAIKLFQGGDRTNRTPFWIHLVW